MVIVSVVIESIFIVFLCYLLIEKSISENEQNGKYRRFLQKNAVQLGCVDTQTDPWFLKLTTPIKIIEFVSFVNYYLSVILYQLVQIFFLQ